jgi:hypothetical protein
VQIPIIHARVGTNRSTEETLRGLTVALNHDITNTPDAQVLCVDNFSLPTPRCSLWYLMLSSYRKRLDMPLTSTLPGLVGPFSARLFRNTVLGVEAILKLLAVLV